MHSRKYNFTISYSSQDEAFVKSLIGELSKQGHAITTDVDILSEVIGRPASSLQERLKNSDAFIFILSKNSISSAYLIGEILIAKAYAVESQQLLFICITIDETEVPIILNDILALRAVGTAAVEGTANAIRRATDAFVGRRLAREQQAAEAAQRLENNVAQYVDDAIRNQQIAEKWNKIKGTTWQILGFIALTLGVLATFVALGTIKEDVVSIPVVIKSVVSVTLLAAAAKYAFTLGKSYVSESLKNADRIHAIMFGQFYLKAYGQSTNWAELKEVFQYWNIDRPSTFSALESSEFDPKILESALKVLKSVKFGKG